MILTIVYDNEVYRKDTGLKASWGFSCLIETKSDFILFDTGSNGRILLNNMSLLNIEPKRINKIVISHEHWDHNGGLKTLAYSVDKATLYRLSKGQPNRNVEVVTIKTPQKIGEGVYTTGKLTGFVNEQSLVLKGERGWYILAGCSHPGVKKIMDAATQYGRVVGIIGGLHGFSKLDILEDLDFICPCHCTRYKKEIRNRYPEKYSECGVGKVIEI